MDTQRAIENAVTILRQGGIVIFPTDTAFGIGCRIDNLRAIERLFTLRRRPPEKAMPVLVNSISMALAYWHNPNDIVRHLAKRYWPGGLTIVSWANKNAVLSPIRGGGDTIGLRQPDHESTLALIAANGVPIIGSSANFAGQKTPFTYEDIDQELIKLVDAVVPGVCKMGGLASTVVDTTASPPRVLRQGAVQLKGEDIV